MKDARKALARGDADAALALLWNALEPARLAGDRRSLRAIEGLASQIARDGDDAHRREAERLAEAVHELAHDPDAAVGVSRLEADVSSGGAAPPPEALGEGGEPQRSGAQRIASLVWVLVVIAVVIVNVLAGGRQ